MTDRYIIKEYGPLFSLRVYPVQEPNEAEHGYIKEELPEVIDELMQEELDRFRTLTVDEVLEEYT